MRIDIKHIILLFLLTSSLYSKSGLLELNGIQKAKRNFLLYQNQNIYKVLSTISLIQPVSFTFDSYIDYKKAFSKKNTK